MALKEFIVAIELGSSKIRGIAGKKNTDGSIQVLALAEEDATECIRKGMVYNIDKTSLCLQNIIKKLKSTLKTEISQVYVGVGGQSILSVKNVIMKQLPDEEIINGDMINEIMDNNRSMVYPDKQILDAVTLEYKVGTQFTIDPVGIPAKSIEGNFLNILQRKSLYNNLEKCFDKAGINVAEFYLAPIALADCILKKDEKRLGCVLVDLGADTTTVAVYYRNIMRHLAVIPLGASNITKDLTTLKLEENEAEAMKLKYGCAYTDPDQEVEEEKEETYTVEGDRTVSAEEFNNIVEDRMLEIIANVWSQVPEGIRNKIISGIILTGGGSQLKNVKEAFAHETKVLKVRLANDSTLSILGNIPELNNNNGIYNSLLGLLNKGDMNCAGTVQSGLFDEGSQPRPGTGGVRQNQAELERIEREKREREEAAAAEARRKAEEAAAAAERERILREQEQEKQKSGFKKFIDGAKDFFTKLVSEKEEEK
ncbi:MAG: cell division protein FtsA [Prevotella sp.]|nr:cell division protein FtsA [Prevotella sp.]